MKNYEYIEPCKNQFVFCCLGLDKNFEKLKAGRSQTSDWSRPQRGLKNTEVGEKCCTGMWGRSLRRNKNGSVRKSSISGYESSKSVTKSASSAGLTDIPGFESEDKLPEWKMSVKIPQPHDPSQYRQFGSQK